MPFFLLIFVLMYVVKNKYLPRVSKELCIILNTPFPGYLHTEGILVLAACS